MMNIRKYINKILNENFNEKVLKKLLQKYPYVKFSDEFYKKYESLVIYQRQNYLEKINNFIVFYNKYKPKGFRIVNGMDVYEQSKSVYDKIVNGEVYIDDVFGDPDNPLRNIVLLLHIDEPGLIKKLSENLNRPKIISENKNFVYTSEDYERYLSMEQEVLNQLNKLFPNDSFFKSTWYRRSHENDSDLIFKEMHFPSKSNSSISKKSFSRQEKVEIMSTINNIVKQFEIKSVKIVFDDIFRVITLEEFSDNAIKKAEKGRDGFEYPIDGKNVKFIIADRDLLPFVGNTTLKNVFNDGETLTLDGAYRIVSLQTAILRRFIEIDGEIFKLDDVEKEYVKFFQTTRSIAQDNMGTKDIGLKTYILNNLQTFNNEKLVVELFDMLETINFDFVYYDSLDVLSGKHYVKDLN